MAFSKIPTSQIMEQTSFGVLSPDEIRHFSVMDISPQEFEIRQLEEKGSFEQIKFVNLNRKGADRGWSNDACSENTIGDSSGCFGHLELATPLFHVGYLTETVKILRCVCFYCSKLLVKSNHPEVKEILLKTEGRPRQRLAFMYDLCKNNKMCECRDSEVTNSGAGQNNSSEQTNRRLGSCTHYQPRFSCMGLEIIAEWLDVDENSYDKKITLSAEHVHEILNCISVGDCIILGFEPHVAKPNWMILTVLPVPLFFPQRTTNRMQKYLNDKIEKIKKYNTKVLKKKRDGTKTCDSARDLKILQFHVATMVDHNMSVTPRFTQNKAKLTRELLLTTWNQTAVTYPSGITFIHQIFEEQVEFNSHKTALEYLGETLTYKELNYRANKLAHYLIQQGVQPETRVALCANRAPNLIVGLLAILKAGGAYVPLDPSYSGQRLSDILEDATPQYLLADATGQAALKNHQVPVIDLEKQLPNDLPVENPNPDELGLSPAHLAYIIYTSGSTGVPKGVMVEHRQITRLFDATDKIYDFNNEDRWCLFHSFSFDFSVWEIWGALRHGGQLSIVPYKISRSTHDFYDWVCYTGITILNQTPSAFKRFVQVENDSLEANNVRCVIFGGEVLDVSVLRKMKETRETNQSRVYFNMYGITETTVHVTYHKIDPLRDDITIGKPLPDLRIYLLDPEGEPVPLGSAGEIYIGGLGVARGYLHRGPLTEKYFLLDPFSENPGARMYRSGDRAYYSPDGNLMYLGRIDQQIKIRGFRIEPGEIETRLLGHPEVREAVVLAGDNDDGKYLVAYVVTDLKEAIGHTLRSYLITFLPDYMIPTAFVNLRALPLTPNGKLDHKALPDPEEQDLARKTFESPQGMKEEKLAIIWSELLGIEQISRHDNFFVLGGHSLLAVQLKDEVIRAGLNISVQAIFDTESLADLAAAVGDHEKITIPPNMITPNSTLITPDMLPLISLTQADINAIIQQVPEGVSNIQDIYGLLPLQYGILFQNLKSKIGDPYIVVTQLHFSNRSALECYAKSLQYVMQRHDILRTVFFWEGLEEPAQVVLRKIPCVLEEVILDNSNKTVLEQLMQKFNPRCYRMDLTKGPLIQLRVAPTPNGEFVGLELMHHSIIDHFPLERIREELMCSVLSENEASLTTPLPFRNLVALSKSGMSIDQHTHFFKELLADIDEPTLPFNLSFVHLDGAQINDASLTLPQTLNNDLRRLARRLHVSLATLCHLAFARFLASASGCKNVVFGTVLLGHLQDGDENDRAFGLWMNILPVRVDIDTTPVDKAVRKTHTTLSGLLAHEHALLSLAQRCSLVPTSLPLFSALFSYRHKKKTANLSIPGVKILDGAERTNYPLALSVEDYSDSLGLTALVAYPISADRICNYMQQTLTSLANTLDHEPHQPVCTLFVVPQSERNLSLKVWNQHTITLGKPHYCIQEMFEAQVERNGEAISLEFEGTSMSYRELNIQANRLAHYLIQRGVKPESRIAICVTRRPRLIVAILSVLKAGGAYFPLDPVYTGQRLRSILDDASPLLLLADAKGMAILGSLSVPVIDVDEILPAGLPVCNPQTTKLQLTPKNLAYVIYTSGSTGIPKGVMVEHGSVIRLFDVTHENFGFSEEDKWCLFHSFAFDVSVWEIWGALFYGGQLAIVSHNIGRAAHDFYDWICLSNITVLNQTPSALKALIRAKKESTGTDHLRCLILVGEASDASIIRRWYEIYADSSTKLFNMYGPTETTVYATFHKIGPSEDGSLIGRPLPDLRIYLLESSGEPVPIGAEGEIYISGPGVSRGYLNQSELTAKCFSIDPYNVNGSRMYRAGDKARYDLDGNLIYLGRLDHQIKLRGFRIEPGEIEAKLLEFPAVQEAVVLPKNIGLENGLVAYVVSDWNENIVPGLRQHLINLLPEYMIPVAYVCIPSLPLTLNGKLDRRALPDPDDQSFARQMYEAPQGEIEEKIASLWGVLLRIERISRYDNFFELGGNSDLGVEFISRAKLVDLRIRTRELFMYPILKDLAIALADRCSSLRSNCPIPARSSGDKTPLFLLPTGIGNHSYGFSLAHTIDNHFPIYVLPWPSRDETQPRSLEEMAKRMIAMMKEVQPDGPFSIAGYSSGGLLGYEVTKQLIRDQNDRSPVLFLGLIDTYPPDYKNALSATESYLNFITCRSVYLRALNDEACWNRISNLHIDEAIQEIRNICSGFKSLDMDFEKETSMWKQIHHYQKMCEEYTIDPLPHTMSLFRASEFDTSFDYNINLENKFQEEIKIQKQYFSMPKLGWEVFHPSVSVNVISTSGHHMSMMENPKNRSILGAKITELLLDASPS